MQHAWEPFSKHNGRLPAGGSLWPDSTPQNACFTAEIAPKETNCCRRQERSVHNRLPREATARFLEGPFHHIRRYEMALGPSILLRLILYSLLPVHSRLGICLLGSRWFWPSRGTWLCPVCQRNGQFCRTITLFNRDPDFHWLWFCPPEHGVHWFSYRSIFSNHFRPRSGDFSAHLPHLQTF